MRTIFLFFLLINAAYFYTQSDWFNDQNGPIILKEQVLPEGVDRLSLLRERGLGASHVKVTKKPAKPNSNTRLEEPAPISKKEPAEIAIVKEAAKTETATRPKKSTAKPAKSTKQACFTLGPFNKASTADRVEQEISALGVSVKQRQVSQRKPRGYWVYLPSFKTYEAARKRVNALQKKGLKDMFIMGKGEHKNAVSLGLFKREAAADERFQLVKKMGLSVKKETQYRVKKLAWLDMAVPGNETSTIASLTEVADQYSSTILTQRKCE